MKNTFLKILGALQSALFPKTGVLKTYNFDWDDNVMFMPTNIILFHKTTGEELAISTEAYAKERSNVGVSGPYQDFKVIRENDLSYREFRDDPNGKINFFADKVQAAVATKSFGPSWPDFQEALSCEEKAQHVTIITARGHAPAQMLVALHYLQKVGLIKYLPPVENIYPVSYPLLDPAIKGHASSPSEAKKKILERLLDRLNAQGQATSREIHAGFSDDDKGTIKIVFDHFAGQGARWSHLRFHIYDTSTKTKQRLSLGV